MLGYCTLPPAVKSSDLGTPLMNQGLRCRSTVRPGNLATLVVSAIANPSRSILQSMPSSDGTSRFEFGDGIEL